MKLLTPLPLLSIAQAARPHRGLPAGGRQPDIFSRLYLECMVDSFYAKAFRDPLIGNFFTELVRVSSVNYSPLISELCDLLIKGGHRSCGLLQGSCFVLAAPEPITKMHVRRWLSLWNDTLDELFCGSVADAAKKRARAVARLLQAHLPAPLYPIQDLPSS